MRSLDERYGIRTMTYESGIRTIVAGEGHKQLGVCLDNGGLINLVPIFSPTGRMFFNSASKTKQAPNRFYFVPADIQIASRITNYYIHETDCPEYLVLDLSEVKDAEVMLRLPDTVFDKNGKLYAIDLVKDEVIEFNDTIEYDLHLCTIADSLENQPVPGYESRLYTFAQCDWVGLVIPPFSAFPDIFSEEGSQAEESEDIESGNDFTAEDLNP